MQTTPFLLWDFVHVGALTWSDDRKPLACDVPRGIELRVEPATKSDPVLIADQPWEETLAWTQVIEDAGRYRMWYGVNRAARVPQELLCYAESQDGLTWTKPVLNIVEVDGSMSNNVVYAGRGMTHFCIVPCPHEIPARRYRCMYFKSWWEILCRDMINR